MKKYLFVFIGSILFFVVVSFVDPSSKYYERGYQEGLNSTAVSTSPPKVLTENVNSKDILNLVNEYRVKNKLNILYIDEELCVDSDRRLEETKINWTHDGFYNLEVTTYLGENLALGYQTSKEVVDGWKGSPVHDKNLLDPGFFFTCISTDGNYVVQLYSADNK